MAAASAIYELAISDDPSAQSMGYHNVPVNGTPGFGNTISVELDSSSGDILKGVALELILPTLSSLPAVKNDKDEIKRPRINRTYVPERMIKDLKMYFGSTLVGHLQTGWLTHGFWSKYASDHPFQHLRQTSRNMPNGELMVIGLSTYFNCFTSGNGVPLVAMQHSPVRFEITFAELHECVRCTFMTGAPANVFNDSGEVIGTYLKGTTTYLVGTHVNDCEDQFITYCIGTYLYLNTEDRSKVTSMVHKLNVTSYHENVQNMNTQLSTFSDGTSPDYTKGADTCGVSIELDTMKGDMNSLLFQIIWDTPDQMNASTKNCTSQTLQGPYILEQGPNLPAQGGFLGTFSLTLDGKQRFQKTSGQILAALGSASINLPFGEFNDSIYGIQLGNPGYNMSKCQNAVLRVTTYPTITDNENAKYKCLTVYVYIPCTYNVVIQNGLAGISNYAHA